MRIAVTLFVLTFVVSSAAAQSPRQRAMRVLDVVDALKLDDAMMNKLMPAYSAYDQERDALLAKQVDLLEQLRILGGNALNSNIADKLLDDHLAVQRALVAAEVKFVAKLRKLLKGDQARIARVMLLAPVSMNPASAPVIPERRPNPYSDPKVSEGSLFPPGSDLDYRGSAASPSSPTPGPLTTKTCDPFDNMHGC